MGATTSATDNFNTSTENMKPLDKSTAQIAATLDSATPIEDPKAEAHVHGPNCGHDHEHDHPAPSVGKYAKVVDIPEGLNLRASFENNKEGPIWKKTPVDMLTLLGFYTNMVPAGGSKICFLNNEAYKFLLSHPTFAKKFEPSPNIDLVKRGIVGLFDSKVIIASDAMWEPEDQLTMNKAMYFCDEVIDGVVDVTIDTAEKPVLCDDEGCPQHGTDHVCVASDVLDKEKGRCINCLDTGAIAGDPDQVCHCPAGQAQAS